MLVDQVSSTASDRSAALGWPNVRPAFADVESIVTAMFAGRITGGSGPASAGD